MGNGVVTCFTVYSGPDFGAAISQGKALFVDTACHRACPLDQFRDFFASNSIKKVWHNYGFDRARRRKHAITNERLWRRHDAHGSIIRFAHELRTHGGDGYSLEALGRDLLSDGRAKVSMKTLFPEFFRKKRVEGEGSDKKSYLDVLKMQTDPLTRDAVCDAMLHDRSRRRRSMTASVSNRPGAIAEQSLL